MMIRTCLVVFLIAFFGSGCNNNKNEKKVPPPEGVFMDYRAWADEESGMVTIKLQYLWGGPEGDPVPVIAPGKVEWDGEELQADSSKMNGAYYELEFPIEQFGKHKVLYTDNSGNAFETDIDFIDMKLKNELPDTIKKEELILELEGLRDRQNIQIVLSDTSFYGRGIDRVYIAKKGKITIPGSYMSRLKQGPVLLEIIYEDYKFIDPAPPGGGEFSKTYTIKREFQLVDSH